MSVIVNGETQPLPEPPTLSTLLVALSPTPPFVVACNEEFIPRSSYINCRLCSGDRIEIVHPSVGG
jgi:thiamine biosynthesis protein ThiS